MFKVKMRVLLSIACVVFSGVLAILYLYVADNKEVNNKVMAATLAKNSKMPDEVLVEEVNVVNNTNKNEEINDDVNDTTEEDSSTNDTDTVSSNESEEVEVAQPEIVYEGMTLEELASKLDRSLKNDLSGKGYLYASYSLEKGVDPYLAVAISLEETSCNANCSNLVKTCNNVGGMKGYGCGSYGYFNTLDDGIRAFIDNIAKNYVAYGLTTADLMNPKYAENPLWSTNVNNYINIIKNT